MECPSRVSESLLKRVASGDQLAIAALTDRYGGLVWSLARRFCYDPADAEDAVQEIFIDLWRSAARFDPHVAGEATFVAMIARRRLIDRRRRAARQPASAELPDAIADGRAPDFEPATETREAATAAAAALDSLRPEQQRVLRLSIYQGLSHEKISEATGLPLGTVKTHVRRGLIRLRELLGVDSDDRPARPVG
jgi:RNA polymerase sigma-70 factor (ECF subfamily)